MRLVRRRLRPFLFDFHVDGHWQLFCVAPRTVFIVAATGRFRFASGRKTFHWNNLCAHTNKQTKMAIFGENGRERTEMSAKCCNANNLRSSCCRYVAPAPHSADTIAHIVRIRIYVRRVPDSGGWAALGSSTVTLAELDMADGLNAWPAWWRRQRRPRPPTGPSMAGSRGRHFGADTGPTALDTDSPASICRR